MNRTIEISEGVAEMPKQAVAVQQEPSLPAQSEAGAIVSMIERFATDPNVNIEKLERLVAMHERMKAQQAKAAYTAALAAMQPKLPAITERGKIQISRDARPMTYARWEDINDAIKPVLAEHGFALSFRTGEADGRITVTGVLSHADGHTEETTMRLPLDQSGSKNAVQAVGSSTSYGKRYTACALLNLTSRGEDDDGRGAKKATPITPEQRDRIQSLIVEVGADIPRFLTFIGFERIEDITTDEYQGAIDALEAKRRQAR